MLNMMHLENGKRFTEKDSGTVGLPTKKNKEEMFKDYDPFE